MRNALITYIHPHPHTPTHNPYTHTHTHTYPPFPLPRTWAQHIYTSCFPLSVTYELHLTGLLRARIKWSECAKISVSLFFACRKYVDFAKMSRSADNHKSTHYLVYGKYLLMLPNVSSLRTSQNQSLTRSMKVVEKWKIVKKILFRFSNLLTGEAIVNITLLRPKNKVFR